MQGEEAMSKIKDFEILKLHSDFEERYFYDIVNFMLQANKNNSPIPHKQLREIWLKTNKYSSFIWKELFSESINITQRLGDEAEKIAQGAVNSLKRDGFYILPFLITENVIENIIQSLNSINLFSPNDQDKREIKREDCINQKTGSNIWKYRHDQLYNLPVIKNIVHDPLLQIIASMYLNTNARLRKPKAWISKSEWEQSEEELYQNAQMFHFDYDSFNFLKVFIYLSDVDESNGPHSVVKYSHNPFPAKLIDHISPYCRLQDPMIRDVYGSSNVERIMGKKGTIFLSDSSLFHKGTPLELGKFRELLSFEFVDSAEIFSIKDLIS